MKPVFIHGAGASPFVWHLQLLRFRDALALQLPGHPTGTGRSSIEEYAAWVEQYLEQNGVKQPVLVGHSMGGAIAITLALLRHDLAGLVLVGTGARLRVDARILAMVAENYEEACKSVAAWSVSALSDPVIGERIAKEMLKAKPEVALGDFKACDKFDRMDDVGRIHCKTLIVCGADDRMTPPKYSQYLHEKIADSKLLIVPSAGHSVMLEKHREFNDALAVFLDSL